VTGPTGSGKSTTLSAIISLINQNRSCHIITLEDPIEYLHRHNKSIVEQREIGIDSGSYAQALRASLRQAPDVILIGEMRDYDTISIALTAAETGHLVLSTLHTVGASKTIDRIVDVFPPAQQQQVRVQLSTVLQSIVSQQLIPSKEFGRVPAFEIMLPTPAIRNMIRDGKVPQIEAAIQTGRSEGMISMDVSIAELYKQGMITKADALLYCVNQDMLLRYIET
jgi:twitching motility protein PilT